MLMYQAFVFLKLYSMTNLDKGKTAKEEARESQLREEACVRQKVTYIQKNLSLMLRALGEMAIANPVFAHSQLPSLVSLNTIYISHYNSFGHSWSRAIACLFSSQ